MNNKELLLILNNDTIKANKVQKYINCKIVHCGDTIQVYKFKKEHLVNDKSYEKIEDNLIKKETYKKEYKEELKQIELKNLNRSKLQMTRLIKANEDKLKSFITLTFNDEVYDLKYANKEFDKFITKIKRAFPELLYIGVPEFQKNGKVHYHLLTNIDYYDSVLLYENSLTIKLYQKMTESQINDFIKENTEEKLLKKYKYKELNNLDFCFRLQNGKYENTKCTYNKKSNEYKIFKTIKYWNKGFTSVIPLDNINVSAYMSKYMCKDFENRLFGHHRYLRGGNLKQPFEEFLNLSDERELNYFNSKTNDLFVNYSNIYCDPLGNEIEFIEFKPKI